MKKPNRKCVICGNEYYYCTSGCTDSLNKPAWMASFCSENCRNIYHVVVKYNRKNITAEEGRKILDTCDLSNKDNFMASTQRLIKEIYEATKVVEELKIEEFVNDDANNYEVKMNVPEEISGIIGEVDINDVVVSKDSLNTVYFTVNTTTTGEVREETTSKQTNYKKKKKKRKND